MVHVAAEPDWVTRCGECEGKLLPHETMDTRGHTHKHPFEHASELNDEDYQKWVVAYKCSTQRCEIDEIVYLDAESASYERYEEQKNDPSMWEEVRRGQTRPYPV